MTRPVPEPPIDYTEMAHHGEIPDPRATADPSSPQGTFWRPGEKDRVADEIARVPLGPGPETPAREPGEPAIDE